LKDRLDKIIVMKGLVESRERAKALIIEGRVFVNGMKITKPGHAVDSESEIIIKKSIPYVSRGGLKLEEAIKYFNIKVKDKVIMDVGASTGGFTDCLLQMGAKKVYCVDVGYGQLAWKLRNDPRVVLLERTNVRYIDEFIKQNRYKNEKLEDIVGKNIDLITIDVSFISLTKVISVVMGYLKNNGEMLALIKPQFEVCKGEVGKGGIVREEGKRLEVVQKIKSFVEEHLLEVIGIYESPVKGKDGNIEYFIYMRRRADVSGNTTYRY
jgi:23S rRNA (cytidine1920-2'-O)/16S rRNA (cytidine1409-2'-O)-methyltransferase